MAINEKLVIAGGRQQEFAEVALRAEQRLRDLVHGLDAVICRVDAHTGQPSFLSLRAETFLGHPMDRWHSQPDSLTEIIHPSDQERVAALLPQLIEAGQGTIAGAGMEPPLLVRDDSQMVKQIKVNGLLLGLRLGTGYMETPFELAPRD